MRETNKAKAMNYHDDLPHKIMGRIRGRGILLTAIEIAPGEKSFISLPYGGCTASQCLGNEIDGIFVDQSINHTKKPITIYHGIWADTGNSAGYLWLSHIDVIDINYKEAKC